MRRLVALAFGAIAGLVAVGLFRRRRRASEALPGDAVERDAAPAPGSDQASELRRKLDEAREAGGESIGPATVAGDDSDPASSTGDPGGPATTESEVLEAVNGGSTPDTSADATAFDAASLADRRAGVHGRARGAAESMRGDDDPSPSGAA